MTITWHGYSCIKIQEPAKEGEVTVLVDPFVPASGEKLPRNLAADMLIMSAPNPRHANRDAVAGDPFVVDGPGEYEVKDVLLTAVPVTVKDAKDNDVEGFVSVIIVGDVRLVHLGAVTQPLPEAVVQAIGSVDVLCIPCGGKGGLTPTVAADTVSKLDPRVVVPIHYRANGTGSDLESLDTFLKAAGLATTEAVPKLKLQKKDLPQEELKLVILEPQ